jgi:hypothetical protein
LEKGGYALIYHLVLKSDIAIFRMCYGENGTVKFLETLADNVFRHNYSMMQIKKKKKTKRKFCWTSHFSGNIDKFKNIFVSLNTVVIKYQNLLIYLVSFKYLQSR